MGGIVGEILRTQAHVAAGRIVLWTLVGLAAGLMLGKLTDAMGGRLGAWAFDWRHAEVLRATNALWLYSAFVLLAMPIGFLEGSLRGVDVIVRESQFRHGVLERAGHYGSLGV